FCLSSIRKKACTLFEVISPFFFLFVNVILKFPSPSENPANQLLLSIGERSKSKSLIFVFILSLNQAIARCNASILGVRI
ncbi:hypothetical protein M434DRAFT_88607, partial [Hypoxylon sp. CO27-5]